MCIVVQRRRMADNHPPSAVTGSKLKRAWANAMLSFRHFWYRQIADTLAVTSKHVQPRSAHTRVRSVAGIRKVRGQVERPVTAASAPAYYAPFEIAVLAQLQLSLLVVSQPSFSCHFC